MIRGGDADRQQCVFFMYFHNLFATYLEEIRKPNKITATMKAIINTTIL